MRRFFHMMALAGFLALGNGVFAQSPADAASDSQGVDTQMAHLPSPDPAPTAPLPASPPVRGGVNGTRLLLVSAVTGGTLIGVYQSMAGPWWSGKKGGFQFKYDWYNNYWREIDKFGHFYSNMQVVRGGARLFRYAGVSRKTSLWIGFVNAQALYTAFELTDAGFAEWGFSIPDIVSNVLGAGYPLLQEYVPFFRHFNFKLSYWPSRYFKDDSYATSPGFIRYEAYEYPLGDYDGMTYWLSANVHDLLPEGARHWWPAWLNLAVGYGAENLPQANPHLKKRAYYLGFDYNTDALPGDSQLMKDVKGVLNAIHLPAPAVKVTADGTVFYMFYF